jgi:hypothetical protein
VDHKRVERIWRREGLKVPRKQPKRGRLWLNDGSCVRLRPSWPNHVCGLRLRHRPHAPRPALSRASSRRRLCMRRSVPSLYQRISCECTVCHGGKGRGSIPPRTARANKVEDRLCHKPSRPFQRPARSRGRWQQWLQSVPFTAAEVRRIRTGGVVRHGSFPGNVC